MIGAAFLEITNAGWVGLGVLLAAPFVVLGHWLPDRAERVGWIAGMFVVASIYVAFALAGGEAWLVTGFEVGGVVLFTGIASLGLRNQYWLAAAWLLHPVWDWLHSGLGLAPEWYVWACLGFDVTVGMWVLLNAAQDRA